MSKQTAVQLLVEQLDLRESMYLTTHKIIDQALQLEREQIEDAFYEGVDGGSGELYYKQTYGGQDE
jgi:hypothetical protein